MLYDYNPDLCFGRGRQLHNSFPDDYVVLDIETTGLDEKSCEIIEIAALRVSDNQVVDEFSALVKPSAPVPARITKLTGINNEMLENAPEPAKAFAEFYEFLGLSVVVGFCVDFDLKFLYEHTYRHLHKKLGNNYIDVHDIAKLQIDGLKHYNQPAVCQALGIKVKEAHRAMADTVNCNLAYQLLKPKEEVITQFGNKYASTSLSPFKGKVFYLMGLNQYITKYDLANIIIGLGGDIADQLDVADLAVCGMGREKILTTNEFKLIMEFKQARKLYVFKEKDFLDSLLKKKYVEAL